MRISEWAKAPNQSAEGYDAVCFDAAAELGVEKQNLLLALSKSLLRFDRNMRLGFFLSHRDIDSLPCGITMHCGDLKNEAEKMQVLRRASVFLDFSEPGKLCAPDAITAAGLGAFLLARQGGPLSARFPAGEEIATFSGPEDLMQKLFDHFDALQRRKLPSAPMKETGLH